MTSTRDAVLPAEFKAIRQKRDQIRNRQGEGSRGTQLPALMAACSFIQKVYPPGTILSGLTRTGHGHLINFCRTLPVRGQPCSWTRAPRPPALPHTGAAQTFQQWPRSWRGPQEGLRHCSPLSVSPTWLALPHPRDQVECLPSP